MAFQPGQPRPSNAGRKPGSLNKKTKVLTEIFDSKNFDPATKLIELLPSVEPEMQAKILLDLMEYVYPKRKAIEVSGPDGDPIELMHSSKAQIEERKAKLLQLIADTKK